MIAPLGKGLRAIGIYMLSVLALPLLSLLALLLSPHLPWPLVRDFVGSLGILAFLFFLAFSFSLGPLRIALLVVAFAIGPLAAYAGAQTRIGYLRAGILAGFLADVAVVLLAWFGEPIFGPGVWHPL